MKTRKELQAKIEDLQNYLKVVETLCKYVPEKHAICFDSMAVDSGYNMGEVVRYSYKGDIIMECDNCKEYASRCRYNAKHGLIIFDFKTKKQIKEYCEAHAIYSELCRRADYYNREMKRMRTERIIHRYRGENKCADEMDKKLKDYSDKANNISAEIIKQIRICKLILLAVFDKKNSVVKKLNL